MTGDYYQRAGRASTTARRTSSSATTRSGASPGASSSGRVAAEPRSRRYRVGEVDTTRPDRAGRRHLHRWRPGARSRSTSGRTSRPAAWRSAGSAEPPPVFCWARGAGGRTVVPNRPVPSTSRPRRPPAGVGGNHASRPYRRRRQPRQAPRLRLPLQRDLRRHPVGVGLRSARRGAEGERPPAVVEDHGPAARRRRRPRLRGHPGPRGVGGLRPPRRVRRPADRVPVLPQAVPRRPPRGGVRREARQAADLAAPS